MTVKADGPHHTKHEGREYRFCSAGCLKKFEADPRKYLAAQTQGDATHSGHAAHGAAAAHDAHAGHGHAVPAAPAGRAALAELEHICPMCPEVKKKGPGACPSCGMALEPETMQAPETKTEWTCPMHPEVVRDEPGNCPICGIVLALLTDFLLNTTTSMTLTNDYLLQRVIFSL
jgi:Cu+-exporting ATPase